jgi:hypothetical protein
LGPPAVSAPHLHPQPTPRGPRPSLGLGWVGSASASPRGLPRPLYPLPRRHPVCPRPLPPGAAPTRYGRPPPSGEASGARGLPRATRRPRPIFLSARPSAAAAGSPQRWAANPAFSARPRPAVSCAQPAPSQGVGRALVACVHYPPPLFLPGFGFTAVDNGQGAIGAPVCLSSVQRPSCNINHGLRRRFSNAPTGGGEGASAMTQLVLREWLARSCGDRAEGQDTTVRRPVNVF